MTLGPTYIFKCDKCPPMVRYTHSRTDDTCPLCGGTMRRDYKAENAAPLYHPTKTEQPRKKSQ